MKGFQFIIFAVAVGCGISNMDNNSLNTENNETSIGDTIALIDLSKETDDSTSVDYYLYNNKLYSGKAVEFEMANDGKWSFVYSFENGIMQRLDVYGINGYQHRFVEMKNGKEYHTVMFHRNGKRYLESFYDENKNPIGVWKRWYESGELEWEKNYE